MVARAAGGEGWAASASLLFSRRLDELRGIDILSQVRLQSVGAGVLASGVVLGVLLLYALLPGHPPIDAGPYFSMFAVAVVGVGGIVLLPWRALLARGRAVVVLCAWGLVDIGLVSGGVAFSGAARSDLYLVYLALAVFLAGVAYPRPARTALGLVLATAYLCTLAGTGWAIGTATVVLRVGMFLATAAIADVLSARLTEELRLRAAAAEEADRRARLWSRVAGLGRALSSLDEQAVVGWAVDGVHQLGFEAAHLCLFLEGGDGYRVLHPVGLPDGFTGGTARPADEGMPGLVRDQRATVVVEDRAALAGVVPELGDAGFRSVVASPVWVDGDLSGVLVGAGRADRPVGPEEIAAVELLAAHAGTGISNARKLEHQRRDAAHFRSLVESAPDAMIVLDTDGTILEANHQVRAVFGYEAAELVGRAAEGLVAERSRALAGVLRQRFLASPRTIVLGEVEEICGLHRDGTEFPMEVVVGPIESPDGLVVTAAIRDVTERRQFERRLAHQASHDELTGLPNRTLFLERLAEALAGTPHGGPAVAVCFLDVDHFKYVNDSRGHTVGDVLLAEVARRVSDRARSTDVVARFGGDEFAVLVEDVTDGQGAVAHAWRLLAAFDRPFVLQGVECYVSASVGIAFGTQGDDPHDVLRDADAAMYHAKQRGRGRVELFDETLTTRALERVEVETSLHHALLTDELSLVYQPYVDLADGSVMGLEALLRWQHPRRGAVPPLAFVPIAEESGLIVQIGRWALGEACRQAAGWLADRTAPGRFSISVNVSNRQLEHDHLIADVAAVLDETGVPPESLVLEITESFFIRDLHAAVRRLHALRRLGVRVAIDDFGTGFSSLNSLSRLPIDMVKIDKAFVDGIGTRYDAVVRAVVDVAEAFDLAVVAEGVERPEQVDRLLALGCRVGQGFLLGRPAPASELPGLLAGTR
ncbi:MAG: EAL domain-containing protein [Acidobacteriota bacterium]|nr:EAL domain-containing protein [Acidobacteriota bacterium]